MIDKPDENLQSSMYKKMFMVRRFEEKVSELFLRGYIPGTIHLSIGQEAVAVGVASAIKHEDVVIPTHRGHGHALAKGMDPAALYGELFARDSGCSGGKGGSLHIADVDNGVMPANPVVGSSIPVAAGIAFSFKYRKEKRVVASFFGDGAVNTGPFHEGLNLGALWELPVLFVCENNQYAISTPVSAVTKLDNLVDRAAAYGIPGVSVDGNDVLAVYQAAREAAESARNGGGPTFLECKTYRVGGHKRDDSAPYRSKEEVKEWLEKDPVDRMREYLIREKIKSEEEIEAIESNVEQDLEKAVEDAISAPQPPDAAVLEDVYA